VRQMPLRRELFQSRALPASRGECRETAQYGIARLVQDGRGVCADPSGVGKIGCVGQTGEAIVVEDFLEDPSWLQRYEWAARQHIRGFNAQPIKFKEQILGVIAIFTSIPTPDEGPTWMRIFADQIAGALVNARAFEEIERLRAHLEVENTYLQEELRESRAMGDIIGQDDSIKELLRQIEWWRPRMPRS